jgi:hypothetical protein
MSVCGARGKKNAGDEGEGETKGRREDENEKEMMREGRFCVKSVPLALSLKTALGNAV